MNYGHSNISNTLKENELHIISIIRSSRKNKLESPLNNLLNDYHKEGNKRKKGSQEKSSTNSSTGIFRKNIHKNNSPQNNENIKHVFSVKSSSNEINIRLLLNSDGNNNSNNFSNNSKNKNIHDDILKEKDSIISKLKNEINFNNEILNKIQYFEEHNKYNLSKTRSSCNITTKSSNQSSFLVTDLVNQIKKNRIQSPRYSNKIIIETENVKGNIFNNKKKKIIQRNNYNKTNKKSINYNSDSDIKKSYPYFTQDNKSNINKEFMSKKEMDNICNSLLERTKKLCVKLKKFCENN
jgi:hypothetical protein